MRERAVHTFSIVARCGHSGEFGAAVASAVPAVGAICLYGRPGVGFVSTQSWINPYLAEATLDAMADGSPAATALAAAIAEPECRSADRRLSDVLHALSVAPAIKREAAANLSGKRGPPLVAAFFVLGTLRQA